MEASLAVAKFHYISVCCSLVVHARLEARRSSVAGSRCAATIFRRLVNAAGKWRGPAVATDKHRDSHTCTSREHIFKSKRFREELGFALSIKQKKKKKNLFFRSAYHKYRHLSIYIHLLIHKRKEKKGPCEKKEEEGEQEQIAERCLLEEACLPLLSEEDLKPLAGVSSTQL